jgi:hypothetical protein
MRPFGLFITTLGLRFMVVVLVQSVTGFLGAMLSWSLLGVFGVILIALDARLVMSDRA